MRAVIQRVNRASVSVDGEIIGEIDKGILILLAVGPKDGEEDLAYILDKTINLRIFQDDNNKMNNSLIDIEGELLVVPQFTLYGDARKGRRPNFSNSGSPDLAEKYFNKFVELAKEKGLKTEKGRFAADMQVSLENDGPVTILLDSEKVF